MQGNIVHPNYVDLTEIGVLGRHYDGGNVTPDMYRRLYVSGDDP